ncbi:MAG: hypothetical protein ACRDAM_22170, partial [Casimicrobium sp.]
MPSLALLRDAANSPFQILLVCKSVFSDLVHLNRTTGDAFNLRWMELSSGLKVGAALFVRSAFCIPNRCDVSPKRAIATRSACKFIQAGLYQSAENAMVDFMQDAAMPAPQVFVIPLFVI